MSWNDDNNNNDDDDMSLGFDLEETKAEEAMSFDLMKRGDYPVIITGCEPKAGKREGARYVTMKVTIIAGQHKGRKVWGNFTTHNPPKSDSADDVKRAATAVQIGRGQIKAAFIAAGVTTSSPLDLLAAQTPMIAVVGVEKGTVEYPDDRNTIKGFKAMTAAQLTDKKEEKSKSSKPSFLSK
jgi:hypothetical protein